MSADYKIPKYVSNSVKDLIIKILNTNPDERYTIENIMSHPWFSRVSTFPWPLISLNGDISEEDTHEFLMSQTSGGVNIEVKPVPVNNDIISILSDYGWNKEYAIKCIQMNKHNSVTSTYYLLLKHKKRQFVEELEKQGKSFGKSIRNEKEQLINLLKNYNGNKAVKFDKTNNAEKASKESEDKPSNAQNAKEEVNKSFKFENEKYKNNSKLNKTTLAPITIPEDSIEINNETNLNQTIDTSTDIKKRYESVDANSKKTSNFKIKRINKTNIKDSIELRNETTDEEVIISSRHRNQEMSPSPSPDKYDIDPTDHQKPFEIDPQQIKKANYSTTNKKSKKYDYQDLEFTNCSNRQKSKQESEGKKHIKII